MKTIEELLPPTFTDKIRNLVYKAEDALMQKGNGSGVNDSAQRKLYIILSLANAGLVLQEAKGIEKMTYDWEYAREVYMEYRQNIIDRAGKIKFDVEKATLSLPKGKPIRLNKKGDYNFSYGRT